MGRALTGTFGKLDHAVGFTDLSDLRTSNKLTVDSEGTGENCESFIMVATQNKATKISNATGAPAALLFPKKANLCHKGRATLRWQITASESIAHAQNRVFAPSLTYQGPKMAQHERNAAKRIAGGNNTNVN